MCMKCLAIILFFFAASPCAFGHNRQISNVRPGYADSLNHVVQIFKNNNAPRSELVEYCMPQSKEESLLFFKLDYEKQSAREFRMLLQRVDTLCVEGRETTIDKFILLSQFVDGYFADDYFDSLEKVYKSNPNLFCGF